jgi:GntR family transcriptional regulator
MIMNLKIDRNLRIPYYFQLYSSIAQKIDNNILNDGDKLPNEMELCKDFGISRITVRQAFKELETNGYIVRERGRGTFVRKKIETHSLQKVSSIVDELKKEGIKTKKKILENIVIFPDERIKKILELGSKEQIFFVKRLIYAYGSPLYITKAYFPYDLTGKISKKTLMDNSFTKIITEIYNLKLIHSKRILEPDIPDKETVKLLEIKGNGKKVIHYLQTFWTVMNLTGAKMIYFQEYFNSSKGKFVFEKDYT